MSVKKRSVEQQINALVLKPIRTCYSTHECCLCEKDIKLGEQYRDGGLGRRAHLSCIANERNHGNG